MPIDLEDNRIQEFLSDILGEKAFKVAKGCEGGVIDKDISDELGIDVSEIRALLNQLHYKGVVSYTKEKADDTNWCTYTWFIEEGKLRKLIKENWEEKLEGLETELEDEEKYVFFECKKGCERLPFELAVEYDFRCPKCSSELNNVDSDERKEELKKRIDDIKEMVSEME